MERLCNLAVVVHSRRSASTRMGEARQFEQPDVRARPSASPLSVTAKTSSINSNAQLLSPPLLHTVQINLRFGWKLDVVHYLCNVFQVLCSRDTVDRCMHPGVHVC